MSAATKKHPYNQWCPDARALDVMGDKWTLLIVRDLLSGPRRFVNLQRTLPGISTEQLRMRLGAMVELRLLTRQRYREVPPRVDYELTARGRALVPVLRELARWGLIYEWGMPRSGEAVDVAALFRLAPALLSPPKSMRGTVALEVDAATYTFALSRGRVEVTEASDAADAADATVEGVANSWVSALLESDASYLDWNGDARLARFVFDGLCSLGNVTPLERAA